MLLIMLMLIPLIGVLVLLFTQDKTIKTPFITTSIVFVMAIIGLKEVFQGNALTYQVKMSGPFILTFNADALSALFVILTAFIWLVVSIYSPKYMEYEGKTWTFQLSSLLTLFAVIGVFLSGDLLTMLLFFELMTIASYFLVVYQWDKKSIKAGYFYLFFSIVGGLLVALGIVFMKTATDVLPLIGAGMLMPLNLNLFAWSIAILLTGFGIKAGMAPLHTWLPYAYTASPTPSSALLSGIITKVGVYGLIRIAEFAGWGIKLETEVAWLGPTLVILGTLTMLLGVTVALIQSDAKKLLAYHSISQMGYIILGLGITIYLGSNGGISLSGSIYHIINHALFKVALFLGVGIIYIQTKETDLYKLGGLWRRFPLTAILILVAVLGITGAPGFNGYVSKALLHDGLSLAADAGFAGIVWVERLFLIVGVGTVASFSKLYYLIFLGKPTKLKIKNEESAKLQLSMVLLALAIIVIGIRPKFLLDTAIMPTVQALGIEGVSSSLIGLSFWAFKDIFDTIVTLILGVIVCWLGLKSGAFHWKIPIWMTLEGIVKLISIKVAAGFNATLELFNNTDKWFQKSGKTISSRLYLGLRRFDQSKSGSLWGIKLVGISADIAILILLLGVLIALFTLKNLTLTGIN